MRLAIALAAAAAGLLAAGIGMAQDRAIEAERARLVAAKQSAEQARARSSRLEREAARASDAAAQARAKEAAVAARIQGFEAEIGAAEARVAILTALQQRQARRLADQEGPIVRLVAALQSMARRPAATALVQPGSISELVHVRATLATVLPVVRSRTEAVRSDLDRARVLRAGADLAARALAQSRARLAQEQRALAALERRHRLRAQDLNRSAMLEQDKAIAMGEEARDIVDRMGAIEDEAAMRAALSALAGPTIRPDAAGEGARPKGAYRLPVSGPVVTGLGELAETGVRSRGLTIAAAPHARAVAPQGGKIVFAGPFRRYGHIVVIDHGAGWTTLVTGLERLAVKAGDTVAQGAALGRARAERPRVTVELRRQGKPIDMVPLLG